MKLSEAILLGSTMHRQGFKGYFVAGGTCGQGAALAATGISEAELTLCNEIQLAQEFSSRWKWCAALKVECPDANNCEHSPNSAMGMIAHLNDAHRWTRERIAEWVSTIEPQGQAQPAEAPPESVPVEAL